jgi:Ser/Thr protein kinase RdoA (MazF antagonist)
MAVTDESQADFYALRPDTVLDAVESAGVSCDGRLLALNSYENRVYQVGVEDTGFLVAKFYRPARWSDQQILEEHAFSHELARADIPVIAPVVDETGASLRRHLGYRFALYPRRGGRAPELGDEDNLRWLGRQLGRIHAVGSIGRFQHRSRVTVAAMGEAARDYLLGHDFIPAHVLPAWESVSRDLLVRVHAAFDRAGNYTELRLHGDCHPGNILWTDTGPHFVDLDDSRNGPAIQDLWMLLAGERGERTRQLSCVLEGYGQFSDFDPRELHLLEALRALRLLGFSAWIARRWRDPAFPLAFPWFASHRYWEEQVLTLREQMAALDEPPLSI